MPDKTADLPVRRASEREPVSERSETPPSGLNFVELFLVQSGDTKPKTDKDKAPPAAPADGTVIVNGEKVGPADTPPHLSNKAELEVTLADGKYSRDSSGRVVATESPDGKETRSFKYEDKADPKQATTITINDTVYKHLGPITSVPDRKPVMQEGYMMSSWSVYDSKGNFKNNWYGYLGVNENGVYTVFDDKTKKLWHEGANGQQIDAAEASKRTKDGIWPGSVEVSRPDGTSVKAQLKGQTVEKLVETVKENGKEITRQWHRDRDKYLSDDKPPKERASIKIDSKGALTVVETDGTSSVCQRDASRSVTKDGTTNLYNPAGAHIGVRSTDGHRVIKPIDPKDPSSAPAEVETVSGNYRSKWTCKAGTDEWTDGKTTEVRKELQVLPDGTFEWKNDAGLKMRESIILSRTRFDTNGAATNVDFASGASRELAYDDKGLKTVTDRIPPKDAKGSTTTNVWEREGDTATFISKREKDQVFRREQMSVVNDGDLKYVGQDKRQHVSQSRDLDRIARGEFVLSSESQLEARQRLLDGAKAAGIKMDRFEGWVKEFEEKAITHKVDPEKVVKAMNHLSDILASSEKSPHYDKAQLTTIVDTGMHNLARPLEIDQGSHPTCNVTSVEVYAAVKEPDHIARLLKEVSLTGKWTTFDGKTVTPPADALKPGKDETAYDLDKVDSGLRNLASQVVQMTLINATYETGLMNTKKIDQETKKEVVTDRSGYRYVMGPNRTEEQWMNGNKVIVDMGEDALKDGKGQAVKGKDGKLVHGPEMYQEDVLDSAKLLFGSTPPYIECSGYSDDTGTRKYFNHLPTAEKLLEMKEKNQLPILTPTMGGMHSQTIHDVWEDKRDKKLWVLLDNQHGEPEAKGQKRGGRVSALEAEGDGDGWITLDVLHATLKFPGQGAGMGKAVMPLIQKYDHPSKHQPGGADASRPAYSEAGRMTPFIIERSVFAVPRGFTAPSPVYSGTIPGYRD